MQHRSCSKVLPDTSCSKCAGPTGTEALKNLVLGGIAAFTVVDGGTVKPADLSNNFMVEASTLGQARAPAVTASLKARACPPVRQTLVCTSSTAAQQHMQIA